MSAELGILLAAPARLAEALARIERPETTQLFLMHEGVRALDDPRLAALVDEGAELALCAMDAEARGFSPTDGGPRFGSQYDHAQMIRDARRIITLTPAQVDESCPSQRGRRRVQVALTGDARDPDTVQGLRSAVGYLGCDLSVALVIGPAARALGNDDHPTAVARPLLTLRGLGVPFFESEKEAPPCDVRVTW